MHTRSTAELARRRLPLPAALLRVASDERLVSELRAGSDRAFEVLFDRHYPRLLAFCRHLLGSVEEAEDAVQYSFLAAHRDLVESQKPIVARPWLYTIARHRCLSILRARREHSIEDAPEPAIDNLVADVTRREDLRALLADMGRLPEEQRAALVLMELGDLSHEEIAGVLGCSRDRIKSLVFMARSSLTTSRAARDASCIEIREQLAARHKDGLSQTTIRRHLHSCEPCRSFRADVRAQRRGFALLLPVMASPGLRASVLSAVFGGGGGTGGGVAVTGALLGGDLAAKALIVAAVVGGSGVATTIAPAGQSSDRVVPTATAPRSVTAMEQPPGGARPVAGPAGAAPIDRSLSRPPGTGPRRPDTAPPTTQRALGETTHSRPATNLKRSEPPEAAHTSARGANKPDEMNRASHRPPSDTPANTKPDKPAKPDKPTANADKQTKPDKPTKTDKPVAATKPDKPAKAGKPDKPDKPTNTDKRDEPATADKPAKPAAATKPDKPATPDKPAKPDKPVVDTAAKNQPDKLATNPESAKFADNAAKPDVAPPGKPVASNPAAAPDPAASIDDIKAKPAGSGGLATKTR